MSTFVSTGGAAPTEKDPAEGPANWATSDMEGSVEGGWDEGRKNRAGQLFLLKETLAVVVEERFVLWKGRKVQA